VNCGIVLFQMRRGIEAGDDGGLGCQRRTRSAAIFWQVQGISTCARERGTSERSKRVSGLLNLAGIGEKEWRQ
jgi:hypothetical protein